MFIRRLHAMLAVAVAAIGLATAGTAAAMTAAVGEPQLSAKVLIDVPMTVSCDPVSPGLVVFMQSVTVLVEQASGRQIARGTQTVFASFPQPLLFACDGTPTTLSVSVLADPSGPPFHGGRAVVRVTATAEAGVPLPFGGFTGPFERQSVTVGPLETRLR